MAEGSQLQCNPNVAEALLPVPKHCAPLLILCQPAEILIILVQYGTQIRSRPFRLIVVLSPTGALALVPIRKLFAIICNAL